MLIILLELLNVIFMLRMNLFIKLEEVIRINLHINKNKDDDSHELEFSTIRCVQKGHEVGIHKYLQGRLLQSAD